MRCQIREILRAGQQMRTAMGSRKPSMVLQHHSHLVENEISEASRASLICIYFVKKIPRLLLPSRHFY